MCDFSGKLIAWMDRELVDDDAAPVERHVLGCKDCQSRVAAYKEVSRAFAAYYDLAAEPQTHRKIPLWAPILSGAAAVVAMLALIFMRLPVQQIPTRKQVVENRPAVVLDVAPKSLARVPRRHAIERAKTLSVEQPLADPIIQIAIPAEAMFAPGAVPEGVEFVANLNMAADGSEQRLRLQP
jgi:anti-sigma factor RsiW